MTFTIGGHNFETEFPTGEAIQREYPNISGISIEALEIPRMERRRFLEPTRPFTALTFDVILHADSEEDIELERQKFMLIVDPTLGPQTFIRNEDPRWYWNMTVAQEIIWERLTWHCNAGGFRLRATVTFESFGDAAARLIDEPLSTTLQAAGNTRTWPTVEFTGTLSSAQEARVRIGDFRVRVAGPLTSQDTAVLNYDLMRFEVFRQGVKVASLVPRMSTLEQTEIRPQDGPVTFSVVPVSGGSITSALATANSRKQ